MLEKLDAQHKLTANQWKIAFAATIGDMLNFFDFGLIAFVLAFIVKDWHLTFGQSGMILLASGISAPFGSLLWGWAADKIGRRKAMIGTVLNTSIATGAMALMDPKAIELPAVAPAVEHTRWTELFKYPRSIFAGALTGLSHRPGLFGRSPRTAVAVAKHPLVAAAACSLPAEEGRALLGEHHVPWMGRSCSGGWRASRRRD